MRRKSCALIFFALTFLSVSGTSFAVQKSKKATPLSRAIQDYDDDRLDDAMERFMEILSSGAPEEAVIARDYLNRITLKQSGRSPEEKVHGLTEQAPVIQTPRVAEKNLLIKQGELPIQVQEKSKDKFSAPPKSGEAAEAPKIQEKPQEVQVTPEALEEYYQRRFRAGRLAIYGKLKKRKSLRVELKGEDKILALLIPQEELFETGSNYQKQAKDLLPLIVEAAYYHPQHLIRVYPAAPRGKSSILDLQRATVLGGYLAAKGIAAERVEVELESTVSRSFGQEYPAKVVANTLAGRGGSLVLVFEEFSDPFYRHYFLTKYLPQRATKKDYPTLSLGLSAEKIDARVGGGAVVEFFANSNPTPIAQWSLKILSAAGEAVWTKSGHGSVLESVYFEGKNANLEFLDSGLYAIEAQALNVAGGKVTATKELEIIAPEKVVIATAPVQAEASTQAKTAAILAPLPKKPKTLGLKPNNNHVKQEPAAVSEGMLVGEVLTYKVSFDANDEKVPPSQIAMLEQFASAAKLYPLQRFSVIGQASPDEKDANNLARKRVENVVDILASKYGVERSRLNLTWAIGEKDKRQVEIFVEE